MQAKYSIIDSDFYNFDETGFLIGLITPRMVVTRADRRGRAREYSQAIGNRRQRLFVLMAKVGCPSIFGCLRRQSPCKLVL
jgi:hypothetical protein